jgi:hypothetical protein
VTKLTLVAAFAFALPLITVLGRAITAVLRLVLAMEEGLNLWLRRRRQGWAPGPWRLQ